MNENTERGFDWVRLPVIAAVARLPPPYATHPQPVTPSRAGSRSRGCPGPSAIYGMAHDHGRHHRAELQGVFIGE